MMDRLPLPIIVAALFVPLGGCDPVGTPQPAVAPDAESPAVAETPVRDADPPAKGAGAATPTPSDPVAALPEPDASGYIETTFDDVKFEMTKTELFDRAMLTPKINALLGKKIRIRGYMYPTLRKNGLKKFVLVRDNMECCFGPGAALFDCVLVTMAPEETAEYSIRPIAVEGTIRLEELPGGPDGRPLAIYQMIGDAVK